MKNKIVSQQSDPSYSPSWLIICPICNKNGDKTVITDPESGEIIICSNCGVVISEKIRESNMPEWRAFNTIEFNDRSRIGTPSALLDMTWDLQLLLEEIVGVLAARK